MAANRVSVCHAAARVVVEVAEESGMERYQSQGSSFTLNGAETSGSSTCEPNESALQFGLSMTTVVV